MPLTEILALVAVLISLLTLVAMVVHDTFDIAWKIAEHRNTNEKKEMTASRFPKPDGHSLI